MESTVKKLMIWTVWEEKRGGGEKKTGYFFSLSVTIKPGKRPRCREFLEDNKAATPITLLTAVTVALMPNHFHVVLEPAHQTA